VNRLKAIANANLPQKSEKVNSFNMLENNYTENDTQRSQEQPIRK
jgi:hypothetical protein